MEQVFKLWSPTTETKSFEAMKLDDLNGLLLRLMAEWENEVVEFKNVGDSYSTSDIGKYFSALSNEANLRNQDRGWLVFGVDRGRPGFLMYPYAITGKPTESLFWSPLSGDYRRSRRLEESSARSSNDEPHLSHGTVRTPLDRIGAPCTARL